MVIKLQVPNIDFSVLSTHCKNLLTKIQTESNVPNITVFHLKLVQNGNVLIRSIYRIDSLM